MFGFIFTFLVQIFLYWKFTLSALSYRAVARHKLQCQGHIRGKEHEKIIFCVLTMSWYEWKTLTLTNTADIVSHVVGSSTQKGNWKKYWEKHTKKSFGACQILGCSSDAHIYVKGLQQNFILPTCQSCNMDPNYAYTGNTANWVSVKANAVVAWVERDDNTFE